MMSLWSRVGSSCLSAERRTF